MPTRIIVSYKYNQVCFKTATAVNAVGGRATQRPLEFHSRAGRAPSHGILKCPSADAERHFKGTEGSGIHCRLSGAMWIPHRGKLPKKKKKANPKRGGEFMQTKQKTGRSSLFIPVNCTSVSYRTRDFHYSGVVL